MDFLLIVFLVCAFWKADFCKTGFHKDYLSVSGTKPVKGILSMLVVLHHLSRKVGGGPLLFFLDNAGVVCVALFFFLSGYGLQKSYLSKPGYQESILKKRIPSVLLPYLALTAIYWGFSGFGGIPYIFPQVLRAIYSGDPIVTYSWYILCILVFYAVFYLSALLFGRRSRDMVLCNMVFAGLWVFLCRALEYGYHWYNAAIAFPFGIFWAVYEKALIPKLQKHYLPALLVSAVSFGGCFLGALYTTTDTRIPLTLFWAACCALAVLVVLVLMKVSFRNAMLQFLGEISFELYGIHGLFITLYRSLLFYIDTPLLYGSAVIASSVAAAWLLHQVFQVLLKRIL